VVVRSPAAARELQDAVRSELAEHKVPHRVVFVDRLPRTGSGKVRKAELRERYGAPHPADAAGASENGAVAEARDATEAVVASVWEAVLAVPRVGIHDDFFALGGHSLAAAQIAARLHDAFAVDVPVAAVFESPTVAELADVVRRLVTTPTG
jgi:acyl carrier protein